MPPEGHSAEEVERPWVRRLMWASLVAGTIPAMVAFVVGYRELGGLWLTLSLLVQGPCYLARARTEVKYAEMGEKIASGEAGGDRDLLLQWLAYGEDAYARDRLFLLSIGSLFLAGGLIMGPVLCLTAYHIGLKPTPFQTSVVVAISGGFLALGCFLLRRRRHMRPSDWVEKLRRKVAEGESRDPDFAHGLGL